ncbi:MAG: hypothetical protein RBR97_11935 [Bacteroidales bacterium]|jgi:hypothetical protein|nr:hypothetical protein [Bacteroidales bacterium]
MEINSERVIFVQVLNMEKYDGVYDSEGNIKDYYLSSGGSYPDTIKHEQFNFKSIDGKYYGYLPPYSKIDLDRVNQHAIVLDRKGRRVIPKSLVVFTTTSDITKTGRYICGFYTRANLYEEPLKMKNPFRFVKDDGSYASFSAVTEVKNAILIPREERTFQILNGKKISGGFGQSNIWYCDKNPEYKKEIIKYIEWVISNRNR